MATPELEPLQNSAAWWAPGTKPGGSIEANVGLPVARPLPPSPDLLQAADPGIPKGGPAASGAGRIAGPGLRELGTLVAPFRIEAATEAPTTE